MLHAVELSLLILVLSIVSAIVGIPGIAEKWMLWILLAGGASGEHRAFCCDHGLVAVAVIP